MPGPRSEKRTRPTPGPLPDGGSASARTAAAPKRAGNGAPRGAPKPEATGNGGRRGRAGRAASERPEVALHGLLRGLRAGDLESVLLTVAMAAEENRMPSPDPDEVGRILAFLARLAEHEAGLPQLSDGPGRGP
jgi:hypothetical protein